MSEDEDIVEVVIFPDGKVVMEVKNVQGPSCAEITKAAEEVLGGKVDRKYKPEFEAGVRNNSSVKKKKQQHTGG